MCRLDRVVLGAAEVAHRLAGQVPTLPLNREDVLDRCFLVLQLDVADFQLLLVLHAQLASGMPVEIDVVAFPHVQRVPAVCFLDALLQGEQFPFRLQGNQGLKRRVDLQGFRIDETPFRFVVGAGVVGSGVLGSFHADGFSATSQGVLTGFSRLVMTKLPHLDTGSKQ